MTAPGITVAVCARPGTRTLDLCLAALRRAGADPIAFTAPPRHGLSQARNAALDAARGSAVLAMIEEDVLVSECWLAGLRRAWLIAPDDCGCIAGPLAPRFVASRPAWLTDAFLGVLGVGSGVHTFHGGNVSFRVEALLGIGGFWPATGRPELRDWFGEEHYAQHELAAAGWTSREEPTAAATRLIDSASMRPSGVLALRARYGARSALVGERRSRATAARTATLSAAGIAAAVARRDMPTAMERAGRAAENTGTLIAGPLAWRDLEPSAEETPFLHSVPRRPARRRMRALRRIGPLVLVYHRVDHGPGADVDPRTFAAQIELLARRRSPVTMEEIAEGQVPRDAVAVTFDDGYAETLRATLPVLEAARVPATVYIATGYAVSQRPYWWDELECLLPLAAGAPLRLTVDGETRAWADGATALRHLLAWLQPKLPETIDTTIADLRAALGTPMPAAMPAVRRSLTVDELRAAASSPMLSFGAHTRTHPNLRFVSPDRRETELVESRESVARWTGGELPTGLAYPFGVPGADVDASVRRAVERAGFSHAVVNGGGRIRPDTDRFALPRVAPPSACDDRFAALISAGFSARRRARANRPQDP